MTLTEDQILDLLKDVQDPEIPVLNIVEMGIVRNVKFGGSHVIIEITPTYSGCPAMHAIEDEITDVLYSQGITDVKVKKVYSLPWTTDWLSDATKKKLQDYGIAPPEGKADDEYYMEKIGRTITCPFCKSNNTKLTSEFGSTACKSLHYCDACHQPFEHFKCV